MEDARVKQLLSLAEKHHVRSDSSHDMLHIKNVLKNALRIAKKEGADLDVVVPAAIFHDIITYKKHDPRSKNETLESAALAKKLLTQVNYDPEKIQQVVYAIENCSFSKNIIPETLEGKVLQDADLLESTGAISILRTFASTGFYERPFYNEEDPFCETREPEPFTYGLDLFYARLLKAKDRVHTNTAKQIAEERTLFLKDFLKQLKKELS